MIDTVSFLLNNLLSLNQLNNWLYSVIKAGEVLREIKLPHGNEPFYEQNSAQDS